MDTQIRPRRVLKGFDFLAPVLRPVRDLPNKAGFEFVGVDRDGQEHACRVVVRGGLHIVEGVRATTLKGWKPAT